MVTHGHSLRDIVPFRACGAIGRRSSNSSGVEDVNSSCALITSEVSLVLVLFKDYPGVNNAVRRKDFGLTPKILATIPIADMIIGYNTLRHYRILKVLLPELVDDDTPEGSGWSRPDPRFLSPIGGPHKPAQTQEGSEDVSKGAQIILPFLGELETIAAIRQADESLQGSSPKYEGEDVAFRDPNAPWEGDLKETSRLNTDEIHLQMLEKGIPPNASVFLRTELIRLYRRYIKIFDTSVRSTPAKIEPLELQVDVEKWNSDSTKNRGPPRPLSGPHQREVERQVKNLLALGVIEEAPKLTRYSQVLLVNKPGPPPQAKRMVIDYRALNECLMSLSWPIPHIPQMLERLGGKKPNVTLKIDCTSGYWQLLITLASRIYTAFIIFAGIYVWTRLAMGMKCAGSHFQQALALGPLAGLLYVMCEQYIDDILIYGSTDEELIERVATVFQRFEDYAITIHPGKVIAGVGEIEFVGHIISSKGLRFSEEKLSGVRNFPRPAVKRQLKSFLGLASYFRGHVRNFSIIAKPLQDEIGSYARGERSARVVWTPTLQKAFEDLRDAVDNCATLYFLEEGNDPIFLETDASNYGIGAYLYQRRNEIDYPTAFISKALDRTQLKWSVPEKEMYAIFYALVKLEHLLRDVPFTLLTDHANLTRIYTSGSQRVLRWRMYIQEFNFSLRKIKGEFNVVADAFSRLCEMKHPDDTDLEEVNGVDDPFWESDDPFLVELANIFLDDETLASLTEPEFIALVSSPVERDTAIYAERPQFFSQATSAEIEGDVSSVPISLPETEVSPPGEYDQSIFEGREQTRIQALNLSNSSRVVEGAAAVEAPGKRRRVLAAAVPPSAVLKRNIPKEFWDKIKLEHSTQVGHYGVNATIARLLRRGKAWPYMRDHVTEFVRRCPVCQKLSETRVAIHSFPFTLATDIPMAHLQIDTIGPLPKNQDDQEHVVCIIDRCTRYVTLHAVKSTSAEDAARALIAHMAIFGNPATITTDRGSQFVNEIIDDVCKLSLIQLRETTAYSKEENGMVERANKEVLRHLRAYTMEFKSFDKWGIILPQVQRIMNGHIHSATGCTPAELLVRSAVEVPSSMYLDPSHVNVGEWADAVQSIQAKLLKKAVVLQESLDALHRRERLPLGKVTEFEVNADVLLEYPTTRMGKHPPTKLHPLLSGPHRVVSSDGDQYILKNLVTGKIMKPVHKSRLRLFMYDKAMVDPAKVAQTDNFDFEVESILDHVGDIKRRSTLDFLVRWSGYSAEHDLWLPYSELRDNEVLHRYLSDRGLHKLIPKDLVPSASRALQRRYERQIAAAGASKK